MGDVVNRGQGAKWRRPALGTAILAVAVAIGCASGAKPARVVEAVPAQAADPAPSAPDARSGKAPTQIRSLEVREGAPDVFVDLAADAPLVWTSFRNAEGQIVVELPNSQVAPEVADLAPEEGLIASLKVDRANDGSRPLTRLVVATRQDVEHAVTADGPRLEVRLTPTDAPAQRAMAFEPVEPAPAPASEPVASVPAPAPAPAGASGPRERVGTPDSPALGPAPSGATATRLDRIEVVSANSDETVIRISGDGEFPYSSFVLSGPDRFVLDLRGVSNRSTRGTVPVDGGGAVERVRVAQFKAMPNPVARVVFDLRSASAPHLEREGQSLVITFPGTMSERVRPAASMDSDLGGDEGREERVVAREPEPAPAPAPAAAPSRRPAIEVDDVESTPRVTSVTASAPPLTPVKTGTTSIKPSARPAQPPSDLDLRSGPATPAGVANAGTRFTDSDPNGQPAERKYTGEPIDLKVTNADVTDVLRTFAQLSALNIIVQPGVTGQVTAEMENVPWDQALEQVLRINKLGYEVEGNIMRIAPTTVLKEEAQERQQLAQARALAVPLRTVMKRLNYANASGLSALLGQGGQGGLLSQRGSVIVDARTNTLIIKELPNFIDAVIGVVEMLDVPEPQVMIEARIIETTKRFTRDIGIRWGFDAISSAATGNTTGLVFPNNGSLNGDVDVAGTTADVLALRLGNVLNTFRLDVALQAAETEGLIHILSAPKVVTLNNQQAEIQSGLQIPIQTVANNTVTVQFVNATLRLSVTPQVTAEGTILMDIDISKREPQLAFLVPGATNAPIATKDARTRMVVRDGGTAVIGGIYKVSNDDGQDRIPGLANIPILGNLFKNKSQRDENEELLIFITPRIIKI